MEHNNDEEYYRQKYIKYKMRYVDGITRTFYASEAKN